ncbi:hypothetical protein [Cytobacillus kochii]|uniref:hypothetical protein n=1 Tax=Cytobacillus kochii TaxID=859143 RepID=UPI00203CB1E4|nr:hypothetical protein [Cytobacillus kochii]MCM3321951.1 hypothetical protein [Cytobacillus kochii]MCM3343217.1 hypothetical protein [Cytobacillus kochii]
MVSVTEIEGWTKKGASQYGESPFSGEKEDSFIGAYITNNHIYIVSLTLNMRCIQGMRILGTPSRMDLRVFRRKSMNRGTEKGLVSHSEGNR